MLKSNNLHNLFNTLLRLFECYLTHYYDFLNVIFPSKYDFLNCYFASSTIFICTSRNYLLYLRNILIINKG